MYIERLLAENFRNLESLRERPHRRFNLYEGDNGQGKTNLLEAIAILSGLRSFRTTKLGECVRFGAEQAQIGARVVGRGHGVDLGVELKGNHSRVHIDGRPVARSSEALGTLATVVFSSADLALPSGEPMQRRRWLDRAVFQHRPGYLAELRRFESALSNRNALLKRGAIAAAERGSGRVDLQALDAFDGVLAEAAAVVRCRRGAFVDEFVRHFVREFQAFAATGLDVELRYRAHSDQPDGDPTAGAPPAREGPESAVLAEAERLRASLSRRRRLDLQRGVTSTGPQRDDLEVWLAGRPAARHASAGQCRALAIAWRIAEIASLEATLGEPPVLLLDDLSSELDGERNAALMRHLDVLGGQVFLTTTDARHIRLRTECRVVKVRGGRLTEADAGEGGSDDGASGV